MKKDQTVTILLIITAVAASLTVCVIMQNWTEITTGSDHRLVDMANNINKNLPAIIDRETQLVTTSAGEKNSFIYTFKLTNFKKSDIDIAKLEAALKPNILNNYKNSNEMQLFRELRINLKCDYLDMDNTFITEISVSPKDFK